MTKAKKLRWRERKVARKSPPSTPVRQVIAAIPFVKADLRLKAFTFPEFDKDAPGPWRECENARRIVRSFANFPHYRRPMVRSALWPHV